jgi:rod shape-determining protein MreC
MKNLFLFIWRNTYVIFFVVLEAVCLSLVIRHNNFQNTAAFNSSNRAAAAVLESVSTVREYINLKTTNRHLAEENARLRAALPGSRYAAGAALRAAYDTSGVVRYTYIPCRVINNSVNRRNNYLTLDKGSLHGIREEMGVIGPHGVVGIVKNVSPHFCSVMSLLHKNAVVSARFAKSGYFGPLGWDGADPDFATLRDIARHVRIARGDTVVTTSFSAVFPRDIPVGTVESFGARAGENFYTVRVRLATRFRNLDYVYVVNHVMQEEQRALETRSAQHDP